MKVIFLDFDGVINNWDNFDGVDYNNVSRLIKIINSTGAVIVATYLINIVFRYVVLNMKILYFLNMLMN